MEWDKGFSARYTIALVDPDTWADSGEVQFSDGKIDRDVTSSLRESASLTVKQNLGEQWIRIYLEADQNGIKDKTALFTGITSSPERDLTGIKITYPVSVYSVLKPANDKALPRGYYVPKGSGANKIKELLSVGPAPVKVEGESPILSSYIVAEDGDTNLTMALTILTAINWRLRISGDGTITICEPCEAAVESFGVTKNDVIDANTTINDEDDWFSCPNCYMAISDDYGAATAKDEDPESRFSTVSRGREVWEVETGVELSTSENIASYALRALKEAQAPARSLKYARRFFPHVLCSDLIELDYPEHDLVGIYQVRTQSLSLKYACPTTEEVVQYE